VAICSEISLQDTDLLEKAFSMRVKSVMEEVVAVKDSLASAINP
jgi:hypothetical protein